jgi:hypothetical protein
LRRDSLAFCQEIANLGPQYGLPAPSHKYLKNRAEAYSLQMNQVSVKLVDRPVFFDSR